MDYSVVVPIYNEEENLKVLLNEITSVMDSVQGDYEIIFVDDGSTDNSLQILKELQSENRKLRVISFSKNSGQSAALFAGFKLAKGEWIITLDADLQNPPAEIKKLLKFKDEFDYITGFRKKRKDSFFRRVSSQIARISRKVVLRDKTIDTGCGLKLFKREIISHIPFFKNFHRFFTFLVRTAGFKVAEIEVEHLPRFKGKSKYTTLRRLKEGLIDLWGVWWLKRRLIKYETKYIS